MCVFTTDKDKHSTALFKVCSHGPPTGKNTPTAHSCCFKNLSLFRMSIKICRISSCCLMCFHHWISVILKFYMMNITDQTESKMMCNKHGIDHHAEVSTWRVWARYTTRQQFKYSELNQTPVQLSQLTRLSVLHQSSVSSTDSATNPQEISQLSAGKHNKGPVRVNPHNNGSSVTQRWWSEGKMKLWRKRTCDRIIRASV